jgi:hypothetical protein
MHAAPPKPIDPRFFTHPNPFDTNPFDFDAVGEGGDGLSKGGAQPNGAAELREMDHFFCCVLSAITKVREGAGPSDWVSINNDFGRQENVENVLKKAPSWSPHIFSDEYFGVVQQAFARFSQRRASVSLRR